MKRVFLAVVLMLGAVLCASAQEVSGDWHGVLEAGRVRLNIVFHFADGKCTLDSPDQNARGIAAEVLHNAQDSVAVAVKSLMASFTGRLADGKIVGCFTQRGMKMPLELLRGDLQRRRPQTPQPPFPYKTEELTFVNPKDGAVLAGTLCLPAAASSCTGLGDSKERAGERLPLLVVMVSGSGQQNRDEELFDHKPFAVLADRLAREGIASFRYDDRGVGGSNGLRADLITEDFRQDALSAVRMLRERGVAKRIGILGHSEGGLIAFMIAGEQSDDVDFVISLAGTAVKGELVLLRQIIDLAPQGSTMTEATAREAIKAASQQSPWYSFFAGYDPTSAIAKIKCPVLALNGAKDRQVCADDNMSALKAALNVKPSDRFIVYDGLNHLFQHAATGHPDEYATIEETISPTVLDDIIAWLKSL